MKKIEKIILGIALCFLFINIASAQLSDSRDKLKIGAKVGVNSSNVFDSKGEEFRADPRFGFVAGGFMAIPLGKLIGIQPEVQYTMKGFESTGTFLGSDYKLQRKTAHLDIPIQLALKPTSSLTLLAGPNYSYTLSKDDKFTFNSSEFNYIEEYDNEIRKNTFGIVGGMDINIRHLVISGRAGWDLHEHNGDGSSSEIRYKNVWLQLTLGITIL